MSQMKKERDRYIAHPEDLMSGQVFYYVAWKRKDGKQPGLEKAFHNKFFLIEEDAGEFVESMKENIGVAIGEDWSDKIKAFSAIAYWSERKVL